MQFIPLPTAAVRRLQNGGADAYGLTPERRRSDGDGVPCRHCLKHVPVGAEYLVLAYRPFSRLQPYAETGPIFLCADACAAARPSGTPPEILSSPRYLARGYDAGERIIYGTGEVVETKRIASAVGGILARDGVAFVDIRSASNNCFQCRVVWGEAEG